MLAFPQSLTDKYAPHTLAEFAGLADIKTILGNFLANPYPSAWLFVGPSGTGKDTMALAMADAIPAEVRLVPSRDCTQQTVEDVVRHCHYFPWSTEERKNRMHLVSVAEANEMTPQAQDAWLSVLDGTGRFPPNTVFVFTTNTTYRLEERFQSRCRVLKFEEQQPEIEVAALLQRIWLAENGAGDPDFEAIAKEAAGNIRSAVMKLELYLLGLPCPQRGSEPAPQVAPADASTCRNCGKPVPTRWIYCNPCLDVRNATSRINKVRQHRKSVTAKGSR